MWYIVKHLAPSCMNFSGEEKLAAIQRENISQPTRSITPASAGLFLSPPPSKIKYAFKLSPLLVLNTSPRSMGASMKRQTLNRRENYMNRSGPRASVMPGVHPRRHLRNPNHGWSPFYNVDSCCYNYCRPRRCSPSSLVVIAIVKCDVRNRACGFKFTILSPSPLARSIPSFTREFRVPCFHWSTAEEPGNRLCSTASVDYVVRKFGSSGHSGIFSYS